jgi:ATP-dependent helicase/nuclease subunit A
MLAPREQANLDQLTASDPTVSAFVAASAGSGKTKLLTDRLLRLMLQGARPDRILCLTFTKAAAAEMALRLQRTLGEWVTMPDEALADALRQRNVDPTDTILREARSLFARVLDLPGGMRIGTIHAFCQSLLRRFPLEAALSPHFQLVEDRDAEQALTEAREQMLSAAATPAMRDALSTLAGLSSLSQFGGLVKTLGADRLRLQRALDLGEDLQAAQFRVLGVTARTELEIREQAVSWPAESALRTAAKIAKAAGSPGVVTRAAGILDWLSIPVEDRLEAWEHWRTLFLNGNGEIRGPSVFVNTNLQKKHPDLLQRFLTEAERILDVEDMVRALNVGQISAALARLAAPVLSAYAARKDASGWLDYDDLIGRSSALLIDPGAAWVLYKLDGGLDHLLLDEVQDTAPQQWKIAHALTEEFFAGNGARDVARTVFAVGDRKQSIYSFQGADAEEFDRARADLANRVRRSGGEWRDAGLNVSFRSTTPVLALVDSVFEHPLASAGVVANGEILRHQADRADHAGAVELWPLTPVPEVEPPQPWTVPDRNQGLQSAKQSLADTLADWIAGQTAGDVLLESKARRLTPGDILILVRRRDEFPRSLVRALKARNVPVAGLDRLVLTEQPVVQDLLTLADALLLPQDDLTFACLLTSPLGGLNDDDLMALAIDRKGSLWHAIRDRAEENPPWARVATFFSALLSRVDFVTPHMLFAEALGPLGGRVRLLARLGAEAVEPLNELLQAALSYAQTHPPSLQGFLHWFRRSGAEVKREAEAAGGQVRIMTVHGAKGLQAPVVILPDTTALPPDPGAILWGHDPVSDRQIPLWSPRKEFRCAAVERIRADNHARQIGEYNRLLYVALTRAEDRLIVCGSRTRRALHETSWYSLVQSGFTRLQTTSEPFTPWDGEILRYATPQIAKPDRLATIGRGGENVALPTWVGKNNGWRAAPPPGEPARPRPLAPSRPQGVELGGVPAAASPLAERDAAGNRFARGRLIHGLLQHLPSAPASERRDAATRYLSRPGNGLTAAECATIVTQVLAVLDHPELAPLFGPGSRAEAPLTGVIGDAVVGGLVDRLVVLPDRVLVADFKTNRAPPIRVEDAPVMYLRQMATYRAVLRAIFPGKPVICALVWTRDARVSVLPDALLDANAVV